MWRPNTFPVNSLPKFQIPCFYFAFHSKFSSKPAQCSLFTVLLQFIFRKIQIPIRAFPVMLTYDIYVSWVFQFSLKFLKEESTGNLICLWEFVYFCSAFYRLDEEEFHRLWPENCISPAGVSEKKVAIILTEFIIIAGFIDFFSPKSYCLQIFNSLVWISLNNKCNMTEFSTHKRPNSY